MSRNRININMEILWENRYNRFIVRYRDINQNLQEILAQRIKKTTKLKKVKKLEIEKIKEALEEINPIIFSEYFATEIREEPWRERTHFSKYCTHTIDGNNFNKLCSAIYWITNDIELTKDKIQEIIYLSYKNFQDIINITQNIQEETNPQITEEIGMQEITRARENAETTQNRNREYTVFNLNNYIDE